MATSKWLKKLANPSMITLSPMMRTRMMAMLRKRRLKRQFQRRLEARLPLMGPLMPKTLRKTTRPAISSRSPTQINVLPLEKAYVLLQPTTTSGPCVACGSKRTGILTRSLASPTDMPCKAGNARMELLTISCMAILVVGASCLRSSSLTIGCGSVRRRIGLPPRAVVICVKGQMNWKFG